MSFKKGVDDIMIKIIKQEIKISHELKSKVEWACKFNSTKPIFINGGLLKLEPTNIGYIEPHRAIINNKTYLLFNGHELVPDFKIASPSFIMMKQVHIFIL